MERLLENGTFRLLENGTLRLLENVTFKFSENGTSRMENGHTHIQTHMHRFQWKSMVILRKSAAAFPRKSTCILPFILGLNS